MCWKVEGSNFDRSKITISSPKHPNQLQHPTSLQLNENQSIFSGSKVARADSPTIHICLGPSLKFSGATLPQNLSVSIAHSGTTLFYINFLPMYIFLKSSHPFWSYKGTFLYITYLLHAHYMTHLFLVHWMTYINNTKSSDTEPHYINFCVFLPL